MSKHTPGPWEALRYDPDTFQVATVEMLGIYSKHPQGGSVDCGAPEADARLIAAAPDLLSAAKCAANVFALLSKEVEALGLRAENVPQMLRDAIAKAES